MSKSAQDSILALHAVSAGGIYTPSQVGSSNVQVHDKLPPSIRLYEYVTTLKGRNGRTS